MFPCSVSMTVGAFVRLDHALHVETVDVHRLAAGRDVTSSPANDEELLVARVIALRPSTLRQQVVIGDDEELVAVLAVPATTSSGVLSPPWLMVCVCVFPLYQRVGRPAPRRRRGRPARLRDRASPPRQADAEQRRRRTNRGVASAHDADLRTCSAPPAASCAGRRWWT